MLINVLIFIVIFIAAFIGGYLLLHRNKPFLTFNPSEDTAVANIAVFGGSTLLLIALLGLIALVWQNAIFIIVVLLVATITVTVIQFLLFNRLNIK